jgi:hypothetical protein
MQPAITKFRQMWERNLDPPEWQTIMLTRTPSHSHMFFLEIELTLFVLADSHLFSKNL